MLRLRSVLLSVFLSVMASTAGAADIQWKLGSAVGPNDPTTLRLKELAERVEKKSGGKFKIEVVPIETIGFKNVDTLRVLKQGVLEAMFITPYYVVRDEPLMGVFAPHGVLIEPDENLKIVDTQYKIAEEILRKKWDIVQIARGPFTPYRDLVIVAKEPVNTLQQLKKLKLRHFTKDGLKAFNNLGISTQVVPSSELYLALNTGVVDAAVYSPPFVKSQSIYEVTCCSTFLSSFSMAYPFSIGAMSETWKKLPADMQALLKQESNAMWQESVDNWKQGTIEKEANAFLVQKGMKMLEPFPLADRKIIQAELLKIWHDQSASIGKDAVAYYEQIIAALKAN